ncbi:MULTISPECIES: hypothetical protein [unclassified Rhizobium]|uniref:hypothetical protein n=1 Tax=unclassified Rhizobium TaxID=2613769 RepID=UPI001495852D|nr:MULTISPECIES: hypothetical protein [unclassified Rhizobium]
MERPTRKPDAIGNIEIGSHVLMGCAACFFGHFENFMRPGEFVPLARMRKFGKKLTNNFIILCELARRRAGTPSHRIESAGAGGAGRFLINEPDAEFRGI